MRLNPVALHIYANGTLIADTTYELRVAVRKFVPPLISMNGQKIIALAFELQGELGW